jgi:hypothetical protein
MVLGHSLRDRGATAKLVALVSVESVSSGTIEELRVRVSARASKIIIEY